MRKCTHSGMKSLFMLFASSILLGFTFHQPVQSEGEPLFITGLAPYKAGVIASQKGTRQLVLYSPDGKEGLQKWELDAVPSGVAVIGDKIYATVTGDKNGVYVLSASGDTKEYVPTGSGACYPLADEKMNRLYVCNQFSTTVSEIDLEKNKVIREVNVLREPKSSVLDPNGKYLFVTNYLPLQRADIDTVAACVSVIDLKNFQKI
jgi:YVTN family beta-propeller protein